MEGFLFFSVVMLPKVWRCVVMLGSIGGGVGIWLVVDGLSTEGNGNILSLLLMDQGLPMGRFVGVGFDWWFDRGSPR